jgi:hypothetical protein
LLKLDSCEGYLRPFSTAFDNSFNHKAEIIDTCIAETTFSPGFSCGFDVQDENCVLENPVTYDENLTDYNDRVIVTSHTTPEPPENDETKKGKNNG